MSYGDPTTTGAHLWSLDDEDAQPFFRQAVELGITFWDTANAYQLGTSEELVGRAIKRYSRREDIVLATKVFGRMHDGPGGQGLSRKAILEQVDASLTRLGTDYIDLYQIHRFDPDAPVEETMEALHDIVKAGKVRYLGASSHVRLAVRQAPARCRPARLDAASCRCRTSTTCSGARMSESCCPCAPTWAWAPCPIPLRAKAASLVPGASSHTAPAWTRSSRPSTHRSTSPSSTRSSASPKPGASRMAQVALAWVLKNPVVSAPIVGATKPHHLPDSIAALDLHLTDDEIQCTRRAVHAPRALLVLTNCPHVEPSAGHGPSPCSLRSGADLTTIATNPPEPYRPHALGGHASAWAYDPHSGTESLLSGWSSTNRLVAEAEEVGFEPTGPFRVRRLSRSLPSAARPLLRAVV